MDSVVSNVLCSIMATIICDVAKYGLGFLTNSPEGIDESDVEKFVLENIGNKYDSLSDSSVLSDYLKSSSIRDIITNYVSYVCCGVSREKATIFNTSMRISVNTHNVEETDIINYLSDNLQKKYIESGVINKPNRQTVESLFKDIFTLSSTFPTS